MAGLLPAALSGRDHEVKDFAQAAGVKPSRYTQPRNTGVCAYFPQLTNWEALASKDPDEPLLITEGELKAAKATAGRLPHYRAWWRLQLPRQRSKACSSCLSWKSLTGLGARSQSSTIVTTSTNPMVCNCDQRTGRGTAHERGALVYVATLENVYEDEERKTGLDDFLIERGDDALIDTLLLSR
jgi:hypothetical protein